MRTLLWIDSHLSGVAIRKPMLEKIGYSVLTADTAHKGLALISTNALDAVILDCSLPDMDGEALVRQIRALHPSLPILILSRLCSGLPDGLGDLANATFTKAQDSFASLIAKLCELTGHSPKPFAETYPAGAVPGRAHSAVLADKVPGWLHWWRKG